MAYWKTNLFRVALGTLVSLFFLYLALRDVPLAEVGESLGRANYVWVLLGVGVMVVQSWLRTIRWIQLFYPLQNGLRVRQMFNITLIAQMLNIVSPLRIGELARIYLAGEIEKRSKVQVLATLGTEKVFDTLMLLAIVLGLPFFVTLPADLSQPRNGFVIASLILFGAAAVLVLARDWLLELSSRISLQWRGHSLNSHIELALGSLDVFKRWDLHLELQVLSIVIYLLGVVANYLVLLALNLQLPAVASFLLLAVLLVGGIVPSSPGKVGVFQYLCIATLSLFAVDKTVGLTYGILLYAVAYGTPIILGLVGLWWEGIHLNSLVASSMKAGGAQ